MLSASRIWTPEHFTLQFREGLDYLLRCYFLGEIT